MSNPALSSRSSVAFHDSTVGSRTKQARTPPDVGNRLNDPEMPTLQNSITVHTFISANAGGRVLRSTRRAINCCNVPSVRAQDMREWEKP